MGKFMKTIWIALSFLGWMSLASAGTYNFYINNTEQGDNGVTTPTVTVKDGKGETSEVPKTDTPNEAKAPHIENPNSYPAAEPSGVPVTPTNGSMAKATYRPGRNLFRVTGGVGTVNMETRTARDPFTADPNSDKPFWEQYDSSSGSSSSYEISGEYFPHPIFGMGIVFGKLSGIEAILAPFGKTESVVQPELVVGYLGTKTGFDGQADPFVGARLGLLVSDNFELMATLRKSIESNQDLKYTQFLAGASIRF
jgi:hypothetical protein